MSLCVCVVCMCGVGCLSMSSQNLSLSDLISATSSMHSIKVADTQAHTNQNAPRIRIEHSILFAKKGTEMFI